MQISYITPTKYIKKYGSQSDFILALSHLIDEKEINEYEKAILETKLPILLDNGLFENQVPESLYSLVKKASRIGATHFFAPDKLFDSKGTEKELNKTIKHLKELNNGLKIAAVVQADNFEDYIDQLLAFNENPDVDIIGLSILSIPKSFYEEVGKYDITESRVYLLKKMKDMELHDEIKWKNCHLLGLGNSYEDVIYANDNCPWVKSNDTSSAFWNGTQGKKLIGAYCEVEGGKTKIPVDFSFNLLTREQAKLVQQNITKVKKTFLK